MSFRPGLLASTSRLLLASPNPAARGLATTARAAAKAKARSDNNSVGAVQLSDKQVKERERLLRMMPISVDMESRYDEAVFEPIVDPEFQAKWLLSKEGRAYAWARLKRFYATRQYAYQAASEEHHFPGPYVEHKLLNVLKYLVVYPMHTSYKDLVSELEETYKAYQGAQATGDLQTIKQVSKGKALDRATKVASAVRNGSYEFIKNNKPPYIVSVRHGAMDPLGLTNVCQVVMRFDTTQKLQIGRREPRVVNVIENVVFDRKALPGENFKLKDTLQFTDPDFVKAEKASK